MATDRNSLTKYFVATIVKPSKTKFFFLLLLLAINTLQEFPPPSQSPSVSLDPELFLSVIVLSYSIKVFFHNNVLSKQIFPVKQTFESNKLRRK